MFSLSAVVGTQPGYCTGPGGNAEYAGHYIQIAQATGGVVESICNADWGYSLANIGLASFGLRFAQTSIPPTGSIVAVTYVVACRP